MKKIFALAFLVVLALSSAAWAIDLTYVWTAPTTGSPVARYLVEYRADPAAVFTPYATTTDTTVLVSVPDGVQNAQIRVAGVDAQDRQGPWSLPSEPWSDLGSPGAPGRPSVTVIVYLPAPPGG